MAPSKTAKEQVNTRAKRSRTTDKEGSVIKQQKENDKKNETIINKVEDVVNDLNISTSSDKVEEKEKGEQEHEEPVVVKRKRGRPANKKTVKKQEKEIDPSVPKRGRGRPKKIVREFA